MSLPLIEYLSSSGELLKLKDYLQKFVGLKLDLVGLSGEIIPLARKKIRFTPEDLPLTYLPLDSAQPPSSICSIPEDVLQRAAETRAAVSFISRSGYSGIISPVILNDIVGYVVLGITSEERPAQERIEHALNYLYLTMERLLANVPGLLEEYSGNDLSGVCFHN